MSKKIKNLEIKIAQNRGYTTEVKEKQMELEREIKLNLDLRLTKAIEWIELNINNREVLLDINNSLISLCEVLDTKFDNPISAIQLLLEWAHAEKGFLMKHNEKLDNPKMEKKEYKIINYCPFYVGGDADGDCQLYGSGDVTKSRKCKYIKCEYKIGKSCGTCDEFKGFVDGGKTTLCPYSEVCKVPELPNWKPKQSKKKYTCFHIKNKNHVCIKRKTIKCEICYDDLLGDISDIEDDEKRYYALKEFCNILQEICWRETKIEMLKKLEKSIQKRC